MRISVTAMATVTSTATTASPPRAGPGRHRTIARIGIAAGAVAVAAVLLPSSLSTALITDHPAMAARIAPWNAQAAAAAAAPMASDPRKPEVRALVDKALARDLTSVRAIELRALDYAASGKPAKAARLFALSDRLSRRSLPTRLWLIQQSVDRGDVAGALSNFDIALRTSSDAPLILFPVLANAAADPGLTIPLARTLDRASDWRLMFFEWVLANGKNLPAVANVATAMRDTRLITKNDVDQRMIEQLVTTRNYAQALRLKRRFDRKPGGLIADSNFSDVTARFPFGWGLVSDGSLGAERGLADGRSILTYRASTGRSGQVAAQLLMLPPGAYVLATTTALPATGESPYWSITCGEEGGAQIAKLDQPRKANGGAKASFAVPQGCEAQWLILRLRPAADSTAQSGAIASVSIARS